MTPAFSFSHSFPFFLVLLIPFLYLPTLIFLCLEI
jgi:hypothetical protein